MVCACAAGLLRTRRIKVRPNRFFIFHAVLCDPQLPIAGISCHCLRCVPILPSTAHRPAVGVVPRSALCSERDWAGGVGRRIGGRVMHPSLLSLPPSSLTSTSRTRRRRCIWTHGRIWPSRNDTARATTRRTSGHSPQERRTNELRTDADTEAHTTHGQASLSARGLPAATNTNTRALTQLSRVGASRSRVAPCRNESIASCAPVHGDSRLQLADFAPHTLIDR